MHPFIRVVGMAFLLPVSRSPLDFVVLLPRLRNVLTKIGTVTHMYRMAWPIFGAHNTPGSRPYLRPSAKSTKAPIALRHRVGYGRCRDGSYLPCGALSRGYRCCGPVSHRSETKWEMTTRLNLGHLYPDPTPLAIVIVIASDV